MVTRFHVIYARYVTITITLLYGDIAKFPEVKTNYKFAFASFFILCKVEIEGLTGDIRFNEDGRRENYTLNIMEMTVDSGLVKVADWSDRYGFVLMKTNAAGDRVQARIDYERNRTYVVTTIIEEPYLMLRKGKPGKVLEGNELYEGYCKDLADLIAHKLGINCTSRRMDCALIFELN